LQILLTPYSIIGKHGTQFVNLLLTNGAKANVSDKLGRTALHNAALVGNENAVEALLKAGAQVDSCLQISSGPRQQVDNHFSLDSENNVNVDCKDLTSEFKVSRRRSISEVILHC
jgi:ankyrin repeat protein